MERGTIHPKEVKVAGPTGLEPATSNVTGWRSNQTELRPRIVKAKVKGQKSKSEFLPCLLTFYFLLDFWWARRDSNP